MNHQKFLFMNIFQSDKKKKDLIQRKVKCYRELHWDIFF